MNGALLSRSKLVLAVVKGIGGVSGVDLKVMSSVWEISIMGMSDRLWQHSSGLFTGEPSVKVIRKNQIVVTHPYSVFNSFTGIFDR